MAPAKTVVAQTSATEKPAETTEKIPEPETQQAGHTGGDISQDADQPGSHAKLMTRLLYEMMTGKTSAAQCDSALHSAYMASSGVVRVAMELELAQLSQYSDRLAQNLSSFEQLKVREFHQR
jgi:hypothetical protein